MAKRLTAYNNGLQIGEGTDGNNGIAMRLLSAEPSGNVFSKGEAYSDLVKSSGTYGSMWMETDGIHYNVAGVERTVPLTGAVARTGTDTGATTGQIAAGTAFVDLTSADANKVVGLPQCVLGNIIYIKKNTAEAFEIRPLVADKATTTINGGTCSSDEELTIASGLTAVCTCTKGGASGTWVVHTISANGTVAAGGAPA